ncbi:uncharacterized protein LOC135487596 [Lineus longissimus]|uniref:uncharacterized protein LOC135487596 n=1 Tax=Lineus longissimus TaxID=88925 RepID=UPI00315D7974
MLVKSAYSCSDERCSKKLYDSVDVQNVWSTCNMRNTCDVTVRHHFLIMNYDCVVPDGMTKGDICAAEKLMLTPGSAKFFLHNPGYPQHTAEEVTCTCRANLSQPVSVTMRYLQADIPDESLKILWDNLGGSPNGSEEIITPKRTLELVYQHSNLSSFWIQISVDNTVELFCQNEYPIVILPTQSSAAFSFSIRIWIILGATSGVIFCFIILVPILVIFLCRQRKRRVTKLRAWNEMVEKATLNPQGATTIQRGTDRIRKVPKDGKTINLYQSVDEALSNGETMDGDGTIWTLVTPSKRRPGALSLNRPPPKQRSLPPEPDLAVPKDTPYYIYETLPKDSSKKNHPYQAIDELESGEEDSIGKMMFNDSVESKEGLDKRTPDDDWSDLYQMASTLGRDSASPENDQWKTSDIYQATKIQSGAGLAADSGGGTAKLPPSRSPHSGRGVLNLPDSGRGTLDPPSLGGRIEKSPQSGRGTQYRPDSFGGTAKLPYSTGGTAKFPYSPPGTYDNARDINSKPDDSSGYDNCESPDPEEWLREKEREKAELEAAFLDIGKTLSRVKGDINAFKSLKNTNKKAKPKPNSPDDVYEFVP